MDNSPGHTANIAEVRTPLDVNVIYINLNFLLLHPVVFFCTINKGNFWGNSNLKAYYRYVHLDFMDMVRVLDRSHKTIKDYWHSPNILKGININTVGDEVSVKCLKGVWGKCLPQFMHDVTGFEPMDNTVDDISRPAQEARLDEVRAKDITQLLDSHAQQLSNEDMEDMVKELSQQKEKEKEKEE